MVPMDHPRTYPPGDRGYLTKTNLRPAPHLTCVGAPQKEIDTIADEYWSMGVRQIVALRGDPEGAEANYVPHPRAMLMHLICSRIAEKHPFELLVAAYPETHPQAISADEDLRTSNAKWTLVAAAQLPSFSSTMKSSSVQGPCSCRTN